MKMSPKARAAGLVSAGVIAGGVLAGTLSANAASGTSTTSGTAPSAPTATAPQRPGPGGPAPVRPDEKPVTGSDLATLRAAALKAVPGATIVRVETDAGDAAYEAHMTKADGTLVTVKFDKNLAVTKIEQGMGQGDPMPAGGMGPGGGTTSG